MIKRIYRCEICNAEFEDICDAIDHEDSHKDKKIFKCDKCGKEYKYVPSHTDDIDVNTLHTIELGRMSYGSKFDGLDLNFNLCDDCLKEIVDSFCKEGKDKIYNSGIYNVR